jgi:hypothetical protein
MAKSAFQTKEGLFDECHGPSGFRTESIPLYESEIPRRTRVLKGVLMISRHGC